LVCKRCFLLRAAVFVRGYSRDLLSRSLIVQVRFFATIRTITRCAEADIPYRETVGALARYLCELYGDELRQKIYPVEVNPEAAGSRKSAKRGKIKKEEEEKFGPEIIFLVNGRHVNHLGGPAALLKSDDRVDVFPVVAGG